MEHDALVCHAERLERLLPRLLRRIFPPETDRAITELPIAQLRVCTVLQAGSRTMSALGDELGISVSAVTQVADRLALAGMVERICEADDRRVRLLRLTERGATTMRMRRERRVRRICDVMERLTPEVREEVLAAIEALTREAEGLGTAPDGPKSAVAAQGRQG